MHHAGAAQLDPARPLADAAAAAATSKAAVIDLGARLSEWEIGRPETRLRLGAEQAVDKLSQSALQVRHGDSSIHAQSFDLIEHWIVCWVGSVAAENSSRRDHAHRRAAALHRVNLHGGGLRSQRKAFSRVEGVLRITRRVSFRNIQRVKIIEISFDLAVIFDRVPKGNKDVLDALPHQRNRVQMPGTDAATRYRDVDAVAFNAGLLKKISQRFFSLVEGGGNARLDFLHVLAKAGALFGRDPANHFLEGRQLALLPGKANAQGSDAIQLLLSLSQGRDRGALRQRLDFRFKGPGQLRQLL